MRVDAGNNRITQLRAIILSVKSLSQLIIVDFSGNPVTKQADYRLYTIFKCKMLKVLDGYGVSASEISKVCGSSIIRVNNHSAIGKGNICRAVDC